MISISFKCKQMSTVVLAAGFIFATTFQYAGTPRRDMALQKVESLMSCDNQKIAFFDVMQVMQHSFRGQDFNKEMQVRTAALRKKVEDRQQATKQSWDSKRQALESRIALFDAKIESLNQKKDLFDAVAFGREREALVNEKLATEKDLDKEKELLDQEFMAYAQSCEQEYQAMIQKGQEELLREIQTFTAQLAQQQGLDAIVDSQTGRVFYASKDMDLTKSLIDGMNKNYAAKAAEKKDDFNVLMPPSPTSNAFPSKVSQA